jgi:hypothetical protein
MATVTRAPGKSDFIKQVLAKNPRATFKAVNEAWTGAGNEGSISQALVNKMRSEAGLSGNLRTKARVETPSAAEAERTARTGKKRGRKPKRFTGRTESGFATNGFKSAGPTKLIELEADIDRLIFKVMEIGELAEIEDSLRQVRRLVYGRMNQG